MLDPADEPNMNQLIALGLGIINTLAIHVAKVMQRFGIHAVTGGEKSVKRKVIYWSGFMLNNTSFFWIMLANQYASPSYATSMFGLGIIALMIISRIILRERLTRRHYIGAFILVLGTLVLGYDGIVTPVDSIAAIQLNRVWIFSGIFVVVAICFVLISLRARSAYLPGVAFGALAGGLGGFDPVLKGIGQQLGGYMGFLPTDPVGWIPLGLSFLFGMGAFFSIQWGFHRGADASVVAPFHAALYVLIPLLTELIALPGFLLTATRTSGMVLTVVGVILAASPRAESGTAVVVANSLPGESISERLPKGWPFSEGNGRSGQ